jgi:uncharacterized protein YjiS (DUF1127 family)
MSAATGVRLTDCQASGRSWAIRWRRLLARAHRRLAIWRRRMAEREAFTELGDRELRDMGLSRWEVERELAKWFWRG